MSTVWVECWKCDECGFRWIKGEVWPERCASSKCRKRSWNKSGSVANVGAAEITLTMAATEGHGKTTYGSPGLPDMRALRDICAGNLPLSSVLSPEPERPMCGYREYDEQSGETMACGLAQHSAKVKHGNWRKA